MTECCWTRPAPRVGAAPGSPAGWVVNKPTAQAHVRRGAWAAWQGGQAGGLHVAAACPLAPCSAAPPNISAAELHRPSSPAPGMSWLPRLGCLPTRAAM